MISCLCQLQGVSFTKIELHIKLAVTENDRGRDVQQIAVLLSQLLKQGVQSCLTIQPVTPRLVPPAALLKPLVPFLYKIDCTPFPGHVPQSKFRGLQAVHYCGQQFHLFSQATSLQSLCITLLLKFCQF